MRLIGVAVVVSVAGQITWGDARVKGKMRVSGKIFAVKAYFAALRYVSRIPLWWRGVALDGDFYKVPRLITRIAEQFRGVAEAGSRRGQ